MRHFAIALSLILLPLASAQGLGGDPSTDSNTFHARALDSDTSVFYLSLLDAADDAAHYAGGVQNSGTGADGWSWTITSEPLPVGLLLDPAGSITAEVHVGGSTSNGRVTLSWSLEADGVTIATGGDEVVTYAAEYSAGSWDVTPEVTEIPAGATLTWKISGTGPRSGAFLGVHERGTHGTTGRPFGGDSHFVLPISGVVGGETGSDLIRQDLAVPSFRHDFSNATTASYQLNTTVAFGAGEIVLVGDTDEGSASYLVRDADGSEVANGSVDAGLNETLEFAGAATGAWTIDLNYTGFIGGFGIEIREPAGTDDPGAPPEGKPSSNETMEDDHNDTDAPDGPEEKSPAVALPLLAIGLLAIRRQRK